MARSSKSPLLPTLTSPQDLQNLSLKKLQHLADEIRDTLCNLVSARSAHFASNLGVVELAIALHCSFDFLSDRLIWDTGHQIYPHKLLTGRYKDFSTIRTKGGMMGYPNPAESPYDLFVTGHAGASISTSLGLASGDILLRDEENRWSVSVIGDGAFPSGVVYEALNNIKPIGKRTLIILNDNEMSICPPVGGMADYLDRLRMNKMYTGLKDEVGRILNKVPLLGDPAERFLLQLKEAAKAGLHGGMFFEDFGIRYFGPIAGHDISLLRKYLRMAKKMTGPIILHVITQKGHGFKPAEEDPRLFHAPPTFKREQDHILSMKKGTSRAYTNSASEAIYRNMQQDERVTVMTAAMCQGNKLDKVRDDFPNRYFDTGICEAHAVAFAAGQAKAGLRPIVNIYSTFLQRSFDHIFQEVCLQNLPVTFMLDRGGLSGPDGKTHHGLFDLSYMRIFPNMVVMAPADAFDINQMLDFALASNNACSLRYPKATEETIPGVRQPIALGKSEVLRHGTDGLIFACGATVIPSLQAAEMLADIGLEVTVINARFVKPIDFETLKTELQNVRFLITVEENSLAGGFGSAVLETLTTHGIIPPPMRSLGVPDHFVEHGEREDLLADLGLDAAGIFAACRSVAAASPSEAIK